MTAAAPPTGLTLPAATANRRFSVLYEGDKIGFHTVSYSPLTGETRVSTDVSLHLSFAFFTLFSFKHRSEEIWRGGRLMSLNSQTVEHGETLQVEGAATPEGFRVVSKDGPFIAAATTLTSNSLWTPVVLEQETVVDAQHGGIIGVSAHRLADEQIPVAGRQIRATRYSFITPFSPAASGTTRKTFGCAANSSATAPRSSIGSTCEARQPVGNGAFGHGP